MSKAYLPVQIAVRLPAPLKTWCERRADERDMSVSAFIRRLVEEEARRELRRERPDGEPTPVVEVGGGVRVHQGTRRVTDDPAG
jgi:hypothetical protein